MPTHEFSTFATLVFTFFLLGAKRLAFNGVVDWVTGPLCPMLFIGLFSIFCSFFDIIIFPFLFFPPRRMEHGATTKDGSPGPIPI